MKKLWYVEHTGTGLVAYRSSKEPTFQHPYDSDGIHRGVTIGPFKTKRAAMWVEKFGYRNPHFLHVNDAERFASIHANR